MNDPDRLDDSQLSFEIVAPDHDANIPLFGAIKIKGSFRIEQDLNIGHEVTVTIIDVRSGACLGTALCRMTNHAKINALRADGRHVADEREHTVEVTP